MNDLGFKPFEPSWFRYPRTPHLPWSPGATSDDKVIADWQTACTGDVVITVKMDGENTTMMQDRIHARSPTFMTPHPSRTWVKRLHGQIARDIPYGWRVCGENLFATHSIHYRHLKSYFQVFSIWNEKTCLSWEDTKVWAAMLGLSTVPTLYVGKCPDRSQLEPISLISANRLDDDHEGYVIRPAGSFEFVEFGTRVAKYVRANHVQTDEHWLKQKVVPNELEGGGPPR